MFYVSSSGMKTQLSLETLTVLLVDKTVARDQPFFQGILSAFDRSQLHQALKKSTHL